MLSPGLMLPTPDNSDMLSGAPSRQDMLCSPALTSVEANTNASVTEGQKREAQRHKLDLQSE